MKSPLSQRGDSADIPPASGGSISRGDRRRITRFQTRGDLPSQMISATQGVIRWRTHDDVTELEGLVLGRETCVRIKDQEEGERTHGEQGLHKFAHNSAKEQANEDGEH
jgi:hypothetical protein